MLPVIVVSENETRMSHISKSLSTAECVPLHNLKLNMDGEQPPLPSLLAPSIVILDMEAEATDDVGPYLRRLKIAYYDSAVLVLLPFGDGRGEQFALDAGADDILMRPVSLSRLALTLRNLSELVNRRLAMSESRPLVEPAVSNGSIDLFNREGALKRLHHLEQEIIQHAVQHYHGHVSQAARALGIGRSTLYRKMDALETRMKFQERIRGKGSVYNSEAPTAA